MHAPRWLQEALQKRFEGLSDKFHNKREIIELQKETDQLFQQISASIHTDSKETFLSWEENTNSLYAMQCEWMYLKGVQDGLELLSVCFLDERIGWSFMMNSPLTPQQPAPD